MKNFGYVIATYMVVLVTAFLTIGCLSNDEQLTTAILKWPLALFFLLGAIFSILFIWKMK